MTEIMVEKNEVCLACEVNMKERCDCCHAEYRKPPTWSLYDAFCEYGFKDTRRNYTHIVQDAIEDIGYMVYASACDFESSSCIKGIKRISDGKWVYGGYKQCPKYCNDKACPCHMWLRHTNGRTFVKTLPKDICETLYQLQVVAKKITGFISSSKSDFMS